MKVQPICVIYFPNDFSFGQGGLLVRPLELTNELNGWNEGAKGESLGNYLWFCFFKESITEPEFKVFYQKDFTEIQYKELRQLVENSIKQHEENKTRNTAHG